MHQAKKLWNKDFILLLQGNGVSAIGDVLYSVTIGYWVYEKTNSTALMGIMSSISMFVVMFLSPFAGSIIDKVERKRIIVGMDIIRGLIMLFIGTLAFQDQLSTAAVLLAAFAVALCGVFFSPAISTLLLDIIPHEELIRGQSVQSGITSLINLIGKAISGVLVAFLGVPLIIVLNGISYLISAGTELFIQVPPSKGQGRDIRLMTVLKDMKQGMFAIFQNQFLKLFIPVAIISNLLSAGSSSLMLPFCMQKEFSVEQYGLLMAFYTAASLLCVSLLGILKLTSKQRYACLCIGYLSNAVLGIVTFLMPSFATLSFFYILSAFGNTLGNAIFNAALMLALPDDKRGSILGFVSASAVGASALSSVAYGFLGDLFPLQTVFIIGAALTFPVMLYLVCDKRTRHFIYTR